MELKKQEEKNVHGIQEKNLHGIRVKKVNYVEMTEQEEKAGREVMTA